MHVTKSSNDILLFTTYTLIEGYLLVDKFDPITPLIGIKQWLWMVESIASQFPRQVK